MSGQLFCRAPTVVAMGVYANYNAVPTDVVEAYRGDFDGLAELCESGAGPCWPFSIHKAWRVAWCALEPEAFLVTNHPEDAPDEPAGPLCAAVVGTEPLNANHSRERGEEFVGVLFHTRWSAPAEVKRSAEALRAVTMADIERAYASGAIERAFPHAVPVGPAGIWWAVEGLTAFYERAALDDRAVVVMVG